MREERIGDCRLILGDCHDCMDVLRSADAILSDPPYGMGWDTRSARFSGGHTASVKGGNGRNDWGEIAGDAEPFDPTSWLAWSEVILWGSNHFGRHLPVGTTLVWLKRHDAAFGSFLSDAELAWMKGGHGVYCRRDLSLNAETNERAHPIQKPVPLMEWCLGFLKGRAVADPYMGSGSTGVACVRLGRPFVGCEIDERHFATACRRIEAACRQGDMFRASPLPFRPEQPSLLEVV